MGNKEYMRQKDFAIFQNYVKGIFDGKFRDNEWSPPHRPTARWYSDVMLALSSCLEAPQVISNEYFFYMTVVHYRSIYENFEPTLTNYEASVQNYQDLRREKALLVDRCQSLQYAEKQQTALEKYVRVVSQSGSSTSEDQSFASVFWKHPLSETHDCYKAIVDYAVEYYRRTSSYQDYSSDDITTRPYWDERIRRAMSEINSYPITTMLFPVLLVSYIVEPQEYQTIYPRMKYQKTIFPRNKRSDSVKDEMESLYYHLTDKLEDLLCDLVPEERVKPPSSQNQIRRIETAHIIDILNKDSRTRCGLILPVVSLPFIAEKLMGTKPFENSSEYRNKEGIEQELKRVCQKMDAAMENIKERSCLPQRHRLFMLLLNCATQIPISIVAVARYWIKVSPVRLAVCCNTALFPPMKRFQTGKRMSYSCMNVSVKNFLFMERICHHWRFINTLGQRYLLKSYMKFRFLVNFYRRFQLSLQKYQMKYAVILECRSGGAQTHSCWAENSRICSAKNFRTMI